MSGKDKVEIFYGWEFEIGRLGGLVALAPLFMEASKSEKLYANFSFYIILVTAASVLYSLVTKFRSKQFRTPFVTIDDEGVSIAPTRRSFRWQDIEACATQPDKSRRILRLCLRPQAALRPAKGYVDVAFHMAQNPDLSLDRALRACASHLRARNPNPVRPFVDNSPTNALTRQLGPRFMWGFAAVAAAVCGGALGTLERPLVEEPPMAVDERPAKTVLMLGNSRITVNDLLKTIRDMADSAHSPIRWDLHMHTWASATLKQHWNYQGDRDAIDKGYDYVILQPESGAFGDDDSAADTMTYGRYLLGAAKQAGSQAVVLSGPPRGTQAFSGDAQTREWAAFTYGKRIDEGTRRLAQSAQADMIDLEGAFEEAKAAAPQVDLSDGGTNPSHAGTYLMALVIYRHLSHDDLAKVTWRPYDLDPATAEIFKRIAMRRGAPDEVSPAPATPPGTRPL